jgi:DMSO/TMAO reductase YedYZ molybdopterin-dependent catalytic subunit
MAKIHPRIQLQVGSRLFLWLALLSNPFLCPGQTRSSQDAAGDTLLSIDGEVERPLKLSRSDLEKLPRQSVKAKGPDGKESEFEGVTLVEILRLAGAKVGNQLRGTHLATYLVVKAADGYQVVFSLPELDPVFTDRLTLLADHRDQKPMGGSEGPLRIVIPDEKKHARWVRQVISLAIRRV